VERKALHFGDDSALLIRGQEVVDVREAGRWHATGTRNGRASRDERRRAGMATIGGDRQRRMK
jgi:hypothetical protein